MIDVNPHTRSKGASAESVAAAFLESRGYTIIERNFRCKLGEIDIIARHDGELVFVEVRSRHSNGMVEPVYTVNHRKRRKIIQVAQMYLSKHYQMPPFCRFDVVSITTEDPPDVQLIANAFSVDGS